MGNSFQDMGEQIILDFVGEAREMLELVEPEMLTAKRLDKELANKVFRPLHTIKGIAGSFGFNSISRLAHTAETLLTIFRESTHASEDPEHIGVFLRTFDLTREILDQIEKDRNDEGFDEEVRALIENLSAITALFTTGAPVTPPAKTAPPQPARTPDPVDNKAGQKTQEQTAAADLLTVEITPDMLDAFKTETNDAFSVIEQSLLTLIHHQNDKESLQTTFRHIHSFKGNCGIFGMLELETLSHKMESLLSDIKNDKITPDTAMFELMIIIVDDIRSYLNEFKIGKHNKLANYDLFMDKLNRFDPLSALHLFENDASPAMSAAVAVKDHSAPKPPPVATPSAAAETEPNSAARSAEVQHVAPSSLRSEAGRTSDRKFIENQKDLRVSTEKLDILNNLMGELVTAKTMLISNVLEVMNRSHEKSEALEKSLNYLNKTINDLQDVAVEIRMVPIAGLFKKMMRIVHDLSLKSKKNVNLNFFGQETEIDKTIVEKIGDPLVHMVRNAIDHGLESEEDRIAAGKPGVGSVTLGAKQEAGEIWIVIEDDGRGLSKDNILKKAKDMGLLKGNGEELSDKQIYHMIFHAGLSTAAKVTDISGRGVGMDVVMQNITELRGTVDINSAPGKGSQFIIKLPLTLAIIDGMLFNVGDVTYTLPIENIRDIVKVTKDQIDSILEKQQCIMVRNQLIPVVVLSKLHGIASDCTTENGILLIISGKGNTIALLVDKILGQQQAVVKPMPRYFNTLRGISGCTILGNGEISLILDVGQLIDVAVAA
jgi:two-component system chemotaxis sensor kinase CheA